MPKGSDRFHVGQKCIFVFGPESGWQEMNGEECVVITPKTKMDCWCEDFGGGNRNYKRGQWRYWVRYGDGEEVSTRESCLRPLYDGNELSTWDQFAKLTGLRISEELRQ